LCPLTNAAGLNRLPMRPEFMEWPALLPAS
jgi:hypothetical protein